MRSAKVLAFLVLALPGASIAAEPAQKCIDISQPIFFKTQSVFTERKVWVSSMDPRFEIVDENSSKASLLRHTLPGTSSSAYFHMIHHLDQGKDEYGVDRKATLHMDVRNKNAPQNAFGQSLRETIGKIEIAPSTLREFKRIYVSPCIVGFGILAVVKPDDADPTRRLIDYKIEFAITGMKRRMGQMATRETTDKFEIAASVVQSSDAL